MLFRRGGTFQNIATGTLTINDDSRGAAPEPLIVICILLLIITIGNAFMGRP